MAAVHTKGASAACPCGEQKLRSCRCCCCCCCCSKHKKAPHGANDDDCSSSSSFCSSSSSGFDIAAADGPELLPAAARLAAGGLALRRMEGFSKDPGMLVAAGLFVLFLSLVVFVFAVAVLLLQQLLPLVGLCNARVGREVYFCCLPACSLVSLVFWVYWQWLALKYFRHS